MLIEELQSKFQQQVSTVAQANELLLRQLQNAEQRAKEMADNWVAINLDDESISYQLAFIAKDIDGALKILDEVDLAKRLASNIFEKEKEILKNVNESVEVRKEQIHKDIKQCIFKARLFTLNFEFGKVEELYELALKYDSLNHEIILEYAFYLQKQNRYRKAIKRFKEALTLYRSLAKENSDIYLDDLALVMVNLGTLLEETGKLDKAQFLYKKAFSIYSELEKEKPKTYLSDLSRILNNMGVLLKRKNELKGAKMRFEKALSISKKLVIENPDIYLPEVANSLNNIGSLYSNYGESDLAIDKYKESLTIYNEISFDHPEVYNLDVSSVLINLAIIYEKSIKKSENQSIRKEGIELMIQAKKRLSNFSTDHSLAMTYLKEVDRLIDFFSK